MWCASSTPPSGVHRPPKPRGVLRPPPIRGVPTCHSFSVSTYRSHRVLPCHKIPKFSNHSTNSHFILTSIVPILQHRCLSKASCRRQRIMARTQRFLAPPQMLRPGDACHRCPLMGQVQEPFSNVAVFLVASFGCCER